MTCASCEVLLEQSLKNVPGIEAVQADHRSGTVIIQAVKNKTPSDKKIEAAVTSAGYALGTEQSVVSPSMRAGLEIGAAIIIVLALGKILAALDLVSFAPSTSGALTYGGVLLIGLVAGTSSCLAVTGGLLLSLAAKHHERYKSETPWEKFQPLLQFNVGRVAGYAVLGGVIGLIGQAITLSPVVTGYLNVAIALVMLYLALSMLGVLRKVRCPIRPPKWIAHQVARMSDMHSPLAPFTFGALTFFLPCGFTQSLQLVALASGSFVSGALIMGLFALGTMPSLIGLSAISSVVKGTSSRIFLRFSGAIVLVLALYNLQSGLALAGYDVQGAFDRSGVVAAPNVRGNVQEISMKVLPSGYEPSVLAVNAGMPVRWTIDGTQARGCTSVLVIPDLDITQPLHTGDNVVEFTAPRNPGKLAFSCSMGMVRGTINIL
jgi:sulfite exporter TauE/SafE/copper chaperone CopZ